MDLKRTALIVGSTGLTGGYCLDNLLISDYYQSVISIVRRPTGKEHHKLTEMIIQFDNLQSELDTIVAHDIYCCLGTTMKKAKTKSIFKRIDFQYPLDLAIKMKTQNAEQFMLISAMGANKNSLFFYNRVKGELEEALKTVNFKGLHMFRPSLIIGERKESRIGESFASKILKPIASLMVGPLKNYRPIAAKTIANCMFRVAKEKKEGAYIYLSGQIQELGS